MIGFRRLQGLVIVLLSALVTACAVFAPLYDRAITESSASVLLSGAGVQARGLQVSSRVARPEISADNGDLLTLVPGRLRRALETPVPSTIVRFTVPPGKQSSLTGSLLWRARMCQHVSFSSGGCPTHMRQVAVSTADARNFGWELGSVIQVKEAPLDPVTTTDRPVQTRLRVAGIYVQRRSDWWFGQALTGRSDTLDQDSRQPQTDTLLTARGTLDSPFAPRWADPENDLDLALDTHGIDADQVLQLARSEQRFIARPTPVDENGYPTLPGVTVYSGLPAIADAIESGQSQAHVIVPLLMVQLGLLAVVVLWLVLGAVTEQRRPELAVARLRGRGVAGARTMLLAEIGTEVAVGVPLGVLAGLGLDWVVRHTFLPLDPPLEIGVDFVAAIALAVVVLALVTVTTAERTAREPVFALLRRVPARRTGWAVGVVDAMLVSASLLAVIAFATGGLTGPIALAAPALLALVVGLVLAHLLVPVTAAAGRRALGRGWVATGVSLLQVARRPATRRVVAIVTVAAALLVFSADALLVGARNRTYAAEQVVGAAVVVNVLDNDVTALRAAAREADPTGRVVTPVVALTPPGSGGASTVAVLPDGFSRVARFPAQSSPAIPWSDLAPPSVPPLRLVGGRLAVRVASRVTSLHRTRAGSVGVGLQILAADGEPSEVRIATLRPGRRPTRTVRVGLPCRSGCLLTGVTVAAAPLNPVSGQVTLSRLRVAARSIDLSPGHDWLSSPASPTGSVGPVRSLVPGGVSMEFTTGGGGTLVMSQASAPRLLPALVTGRLPVGSDGRRFDGLDLDGTSRAMVAAARLPRLPAAPRAANLVNLDVLQRGGTITEGSASASLWLRRDDPALTARVVHAAQRHGLGVGEVLTESEVQRGYDRTAVAWSLDLAVVVGVAGLLIAAMVLVMIAASTWRLRSRDYAALRMSGLSRATIVRVAAGEQIPVVVLAVVVGAVCGVVGAHFSLPSVPLLAVAPVVSTLDLRTSWPAVLVILLATLLVLSAVGWVAGLSLARRASLSRIRESL